MTDREALNGNPSVVAIDRALTELRRGRVIAVTDGTTPWLALALETADRPVIQRLLGCGPLRIALPAERARALGLAAASDAPLELALGPDWTAAGLVALGQDWHLNAWRTALSTLAPLAAPATPQCEAALGLSKRAQLLPVVLVAPCPAGGNLRDVHTVQLTDLVASERPDMARLLRISEARVPLRDCEESRLVLFRDLRDSAEHVAVIVGTPDISRAVPVRMHSSCLTGDLLGSLRCDCGEQLRDAVRRLDAAGGGVLLYLAQEGRGIGLANKLRAYQLQDDGLDTIDADQRLGFRSDERSYGVAAAMLQHLGIDTVTLLTNSPHKVRALKQAGVVVAEIGSLHGTPNHHNARYIRTKQDRAGHFRPKVEESAS